MRTDVVVVGAGLAGLATGRALASRGVDTLVVEARDRPGGRTHTDRSLGFDIDLGAAWLHGPIGNPLAPVLEQAGVDGEFTAWMDDPEVLKVVRPDGTPVDPTGFVEGAAAFWGGLTASHRSALFPGGTMSVEAAVERGLPGAEDLDPAARAGFEFVARAGIQSLEAADPGDIDWETFDGLELPGGNLMLVHGGYGGVVDHLATGIDLLTDRPVTAIRSLPDGVVVETAVEAIRARSVIVTVPLGVLQAGVIEFDPPLPGPLTHSIERLGMGVAEKVVLGFPERSWPEHLQSVIRLDLDGNEPFVTFTPVPGTPVLVSYHGGTRARALDRFEPGTLARAALTAARAALPDLPEPEHVFRTHWGADPWSRGAYSFHPVGTGPDDRQRLAEPVDGRLFFAGEATHPGWYATAHGAYESGLRAAHQVLSTLG